MIEIKTRQSLRVAGLFFAAITIGAYINPAFAEQDASKTEGSKASTTSTTTHTSSSKISSTKSATDKNKSSAKSVTEKSSVSNGSTENSSTSKSTTAKSKTVSTSSSKTEAKAKANSAAVAVNLTGTWNIKSKEAPDTKTHIMAVKVTQKGTVLSATGVDQYGDVILNGTVLPPNKISFKRTYKGAQVNPTAQYEGTYTPATVLTPVTAKGTWSAQPFADKSLKPKASSNSGNWEANIFTGPAINK